MTQFIRSFLVQLGSLIYLSLPPGTLFLSISGLSESCYFLILLLFLSVQLGSVAPTQLIQSADAAILVQYVNNIAPLLDTQIVLNLPSNMHIFSLQNRTLVCWYPFEGISRSSYVCFG